MKVRFSLVSLQELFQLELLLKSYLAKKGWFISPNCLRLELKELKML